MIKRIIAIIKKAYYKSSSKRYVTYLRSRGIEIGEGTMMRPKSTHIDLTRPSLVTIGKDCYMNENFTLLTHDWVTRVFIRSGRDFLPSSGRVKIGNNVSFGQNVIILKGVTIGDNSFIGAGSVVTKNIPANSIAAGIPCKVIKTLDEYYKQRLVQCEEEALDYARSIKERFKRTPTPSDFIEEFPLFVNGDNINEYPELPIRTQLGPIYEKYIQNHKAKYNSFEDFINKALN